MTVNPEQTGAAAQNSVVTADDEFPRPFGSRYHLLKELGRGGMGYVFMAVTGDRNVERVCALKVIRHLETAHRTPEELGKRFADEAQVVTKLSHENLVYVFDFGVVDDTDGDLGGGEQGYLAMEYLRGKTLAELWNRCAQKRVGFNLGTTLYMISEVAAGLAHAHGLSDFALVHRDISPSNVMLTYTGGVKLIDFGLAKWNRKTSQTQTGINWGKVSYMSPEQYAGRKIDHRSDIFSLGVVLWELLTGRQLFAAKEGKRSTAAIAAPTQFNPALDPALERIVMKALAENPSDRFQHAADLGQALLRFLPRDAGRLELGAFMMRAFAPDAENEESEEQRLLQRLAELREQPPAPLTREIAPSPEEPKRQPRKTPADPLLGTVLADRYFVRRKVGEGSMGKVYEGHHTGIGKRVAIKVARQGERRKNKLLQRFRLEATAASQIGHINIADVTDCGTTAAGGFFFVMEFLDGVDLRQLIAQEGPLAVERALLIAVQVCRALEAAHRAAIIHRDLKPSNVMIVSGREDHELVKVLDFGVAKFLRTSENDELTRADAAVGTPRYMAPEQIVPGEAVDFRVDIYAVGGLLYSMLSGGQTPFEGRGGRELLEEKKKGEPTPITKYRPELATDVVDLVMGCLRRDPSLRPQSMELLKRELLRLLEDVRQTGSSVLAMRLPSSTSRVPPAAGVSRARPGFIPLAALGFGTLAVILTYALWPRSEVSAPGVATVAVTPQPAAALDLRMPTPVIAPVTAQAKVAQPAAPLEVAAATPKAAAPDPPSINADAQERPARKQTRPRTNDAVPVAVTREQGTKAQAALLAEAEQAFRRGQLVQAAVLGERIVAERPNLPGYLLLGKTYLFMDEPQKAVRAYQRALDLEAGNAPARRGLEQAQARMAKVGTTQKSGR